LLAVVVAVLAGSILTGCESTQDKARKIQAENAAVLASEHGVSISKPNKDVKVEGTTLLHDQYGDAIVVTLRNESNQTLVNVPILVDVRDAKGKSVYKNDTPGLRKALTNVPVLPPGESVDWVNEQLTLSGPAKSAKVTVGVTQEKAPAKLPQIEIGPAKVKESAQGVLATGEITNKSQVDQVQLQLYAVARSGGRVVAAGRGEFKNLKAGSGKHKYNFFFIGDPAGAEVKVTAPPSVFQ
jgi:hypothetical protein